MSTYFIKANSNRKHLFERLVRFAEKSRLALAAACASRAGMVQYRSENRSWHGALRERL
jgi:hypothetical protein